MMEDGIRKDRERIRPCVLCSVKQAARETGDQPLHDRVKAVRFKDKGAVRYTRGGGVFDKGG